jgi:anthranilate phosphoribosyltransferase
MITKVIRSLAEERRDLTEHETDQVMGQILDGTATPVQAAALLVALRTRGETVDEILGCVHALRRRAPAVNCDGMPIVDIGGTGGDRAGTFNISTTAAFVVAAAGLPVAKHGNRGFTSECGSADMIENLGIKLQIEPQQVLPCLQEVGLAYLFTPAFYPAPAYLSRLRREIGVRSIFNLAGPVANPANVPCQVVGVAHAELTEVLAQVFARLGRRHVLVFHGMDGLDEITITDRTKITELKDGQIRTFYLEPEEVGIRRAALNDIRGGSPTDNAQICREILSGTKGPRRDIVLLCAAAALVAGDQVNSFSEGLALAREAIDSGRAWQTMERLRQFGDGQG